MKKSESFKQIFLNNNTKYDELKGKVVDKVAFYNNDDYDCNICIILFTDKTYVAIGIEYDLNNDYVLDNYYVSDPECINNGNYDCHSHMDINGNLHFDRWIQILKDFGIWEIDENEAKEIIERQRKRDEDGEYELYLKLKEKYENKQ